MISGLITILLKFWYLIGVVALVILYILRGINAFGLPPTTGIAEAFLITISLYPVFLTLSNWTNKFEVKEILGFIGTLIAIGSIVLSYFIAGVIVKFSWVEIGIVFSSGLMAITSLILGITNFFVQRKKNKKEVLK